MLERVHDALASHDDDYAVRRQLHDVPPYAVYEVAVDGRRAVCELDAHPEAAATERRAEGLREHVEATLAELRAATV